jgi:hypothetical protein
MQLAELVRPQHRGDDRRPAAAVGTEDTPEAPTAANGKADGPANDSAAERRKTQTAWPSQPSCSASSGCSS